MPSNIFWSPRMKEKPFTPFRNGTTQRIPWMICKHGKLTASWRRHLGKETILRPGSGSSSSLRSPGVNGKRIENPSPKMFSRHIFSPELYQTRARFVHMTVLCIFNYENSKCTPLMCLFLIPNATAAGNCCWLVDFPLFRCFWTLPLHTCISPQDCPWTFISHEERALLGWRR